MFTEMFADIIIIGGGASGLMAGIAAAENSRNAGTSVLIIEKMPRVARKVIITGKGRCNITNMKDWNDFSRYVHPKPNFIKNAFYSFPPAKLVEFLKGEGLETVCERGDRVFPQSYNSKDVVDTLVSAAERRGVRIKTGTRVERIEKTQDGYFSVLCAGGTGYSCRKLIVTTGGLSYPLTGSTGDGYRWAEEFGLRINRCFPSLTAIVPKGYKSETTTSKENVKDKNIGNPEIKLMKGHIDRSTPLSDTGKLFEGNSLKNIGLKVFIDGNEVEDLFGDIDFTDGGIEGPVGFKVSRRCVNAITNGSRVSISIDLKPAVEIGALESRITRIAEEAENGRKGGWNAGRNTGRSSGRTGNRNGSKGGNRTGNDDILRFISGKLMPYSLIQGFIRTNPDLRQGNIARKLKDWRFEIAGFVGYERCVITAGGIDTGQLSPKTMECKSAEGLYFAGEVIDTDCDTGGYNLQTAFSTGWLAGKSAAADEV